MCSTWLEVDRRVISRPSSPPPDWQLQNRFVPLGSWFLINIQDAQNVPDRQSTVLPSCQYWHASRMHKILIYADATPGVEYRNKASFYGMPKHFNKDSITVEPLLTHASENP